MKNLNPTVIICALLIGASPSYAASPEGAPSTMGDSTNEAATDASDMAEGEVRKVDVENKKITIRHGTIKNLDMPGMTMVFQVRDPAMLGKVKAGDKIRFRAEKANGAIVVTDIQPEK
ncbi:MAG: copper-binding protein [Pseudomonadota bacterium]